MVSLRIFFRTTVFWIFCLVLGFAYLRFQDADGTYIRMLFPQVSSGATTGGVLGNAVVDTGVILRLDDIDQKIDLLNDSIIQLMTVTMKSLDQSQATGDQNIDNQPMPSLSGTVDSPDAGISGSMTQSGSRE